MTVTGRRSSAVVWHTLSATDVAARLGVDVDNGLAEYETDTRLTTYGPNAIATEPPPSRWVVARAQVTNPMNIMLLIVTVGSMVIGQFATVRWSRRSSRSTW